MVDNQHQKIKGYRDLSGAEIGLINGHLGTELKEGERLRAKLAQIAAVCADNAGPECNAHMALHFVHQIATTE